MKKSSAKIILLLLSLAVGADLSLTLGYYGLVKLRQHAERPILSPHVVVLFNDFDAQGEPDIETLRRLRHALKIAMQTEGVIVCVGGARHQSLRYGALRMRDQLIASGFESERVFVEALSNSTLSNLIAAASILREKNISNAVIVSSPVHMIRVESIASKLDSAIIFGFYPYDLDDTDPPVSLFTLYLQIQHEMAAWAADFLLPHSFQLRMIDWIRA